MPAKFNNETLTKHLFVIYSDLPIQQILTTMITRFLNVSNTTYNLVCSPTPMSLDNCLFQFNNQMSTSYLSLIPRIFGENLEFGLFSSKIHKI